MVVGPNVIDDTEGLLPCPFCGETADDQELGFNGPGPPPSYWVGCGNCGAHGASGYGRSRGDHAGAIKDAKDKWNSRADINLSTSVNSAKIDKSAVISRVREFYLGYLSKYLPHEAFDEVRKDSVTDAVANEVRTLCAGQIDKSVLIAAVEALPRYSLTIDGSMEAFADGDYLDRDEVLDKLKEMLNA